ncbi:hypothetical protein SO802_028567 [Lithocarpus litseifolius]|uniref:Reverse transcriptase domain-containing protein n=1 Tax=Lithocarpus litseifolius TaxID=425828 RepID=A0AAW2BRL6_9ROSI
MPQIISEHQSAFISDRLISDNILVAFETLHYLRNHNTGKTGYIALKLDISKAYDMVEWSSMDKGGIGFKDLSNFNDALLAKQTWRLLHDTNSLFYRVFKAKFFPNSSVMEATTPANASYAWRSLCMGGKSSRGVEPGESGWGNQSISGVIIGCLQGIMRR